MNWQRREKGSGDQPAGAPDEKSRHRVQRTRTERL
jgi:hypothetical protein